MMDTRELSEPGIRDGIEPEARSAVGDGLRNAVEDGLRASIERWGGERRPAVEALVARARRWCEETGCRIVPTPRERLSRLAGVSAPPPVLFVLGDIRLLDRETVTIVGTRNASPCGVRAAWRMARDLSDAGVGVASGLALGIDAAAHSGALQGQGGTIAVLGHGLDGCYPREHAWLKQTILDRGGCLVSEFPPYTGPRPYHFPLRNRILAALGSATVVIEARERSGSLITAREAVEQGRDVFAVPGPWDDEGFRGSHRLIQQGAKLVLDANDVLEELKFGWAMPRATYSPDALEPVFRELGGTATLAELAARWTGPPSELAARLHAALRDARVVEQGPQRFAWLGSRAVACQRGNFSQQ